jgi:hypothetical protein
MIYFACGVAILIPPCYDAEVKKKLLCSSAVLCFKTYCGTDYM